MASANEVDIPGVVERVVLQVKIAGGDVDRLLHLVLQLVPHQVRDQVVGRRQPGGRQDLVQSEDVEAQDHAHELAVLRVVGVHFLVAVEPFQLELLRERTDLRTHFVEGVLVHVERIPRERLLHVRSRDQQSPSGAQDAQALGQKLLPLLDVLDELKGRHHIERLVRKRQGRHRSLSEREVGDRAVTLRVIGHRGRVVIDALYVPGRTRHQSRSVSIAAADIQYILAGDVGYGEFIRELTSLIRNVVGLVLVGAFVGAHGVAKIGKGRDEGRGK